MSSNPALISSPALSSNVVQPRDRVRYYILFAAVLALLIFPIWTVSVMPWSDFGDHMARVYILHHYGDVPVFRQYYEIERLPLPNLAIDLIVTPMLGVVNPYLAAKLFVTLSVVVFAIAVHGFGRTVHGAPTWLAIATAFFFYNSLLLYGFVNYSWSLALFLLAASAWLKFDRGHSAGMGLVATVAASATYIAHLSGFFFLCVFIGLMSAFAVVRARRISVWNVAGFVPLAPGLAAYASLGSAKGDVGSVRWGTLTTKAIHAGVLVAGYSWWMDAITVGGLAIVAAAVFWRGKLRGDPGLIAIAVAFLVAFCAFPTEFHTGTDADTRFMVPAGLVLALGLTVSLPRNWARPLYGLLVGILALRIALMDVYWQRADRIATEQIGLLRQVEEQARICPIPFLPPGRTEGKIRGTLMHVAGYAVIERNAISGGTFAVPGQQPLQHRIPLPYLQVTPGTRVRDVNWAPIFANYDYIWVYHGSPELVGFLDTQADLRALAGEGRLYRVRVGPHGNPNGSSRGNQ
jgi:hypothetical protein